MYFDVEFQITDQTFNPQFSESNQMFTPSMDKVIDLSEGEKQRAYQDGYEVGTSDGYASGYRDGEADGYSNGYDKGFNDGKMDGKTKVSTLSTFKGQSTGNDDEWYYSAIANNGIWTPVNLIPFDGKLGTTYLVSAKIKCDIANNIGVGIKYEDGTTVSGNRKSDKEYFVSTCLSNPTKRITHLGLYYGSNGSGYLKDWVVETMLEGDV